MFPLQEENICLFRTKEFSDSFEWLEQKLVTKGGQDKTIVIGES